MQNLKLEDIAQLAGVSRSTVSRVINNHPNVSDSVRQRVLEIISQTGYQPNLAARSLASQRSNIIGLVIPRSVSNLFIDPYFPRLTQGVAQACNESNYTLSLFLFHTKEDEHNLFPRISRPGLVDGIILQSTNAGDGLVQQLNQSRIPFVIAGRPMEVSDVSYVDVDNITGAYSAVRHLVLQGYRRIGTVTGPLNSTAGQDRLEGFKRALSESHLDYDEQLYIESDFTEGGGYYAAQRLLLQEPDALFIASDTMAFGALRAIREAGLAVPDEIALVSFDDLPIASRANPPLTTIRQPIRYLGIKLVETLLDILENGPNPPRRVIFGTQLVIRESCGANRSAPERLSL